MMSKVERIIEKPWKMLGFVCTLIFGYVMPAQMSQAVLAYALLVGGNGAIEYIKSGNGNAKPTV